MLECPICRRSFDSSFRVFVPPHHEAFDSVVCARRAAEVWGWDKATPVPVILPAIEVAVARPEGRVPVPSQAPRRGIAALAALVLAPGQAALATGVGLLAAGTATSIYLTARPAGKTVHSSVVRAPHTRQTIGPPSVPRPSPRPSRRETRPETPPPLKPVAGKRTGPSAGIASGRGSGAAQLASQPVSIPQVAETPEGSPSRAPKPTPSTSSSPPAQKPPAPPKPKPSPPANPGPT